MIVIISLIRICYRTPRWLKRILFSGGLMEIDQIETFLAIVTYGGFHKAAEALHVSQPAISGRVRGLEASLGAELFVRGRARPQLSPAGKALRPHAEQLLRTVALARQAIHEL